MQSHRLAASFAFLPLALSSACASIAHESISAVDIHRVEPVRMLIEPQATGLRVERDDYTDAEDASGPVATLTCKLLAVEADDVVRALGEHGGGLIGVTCSRADAERLWTELKPSEGAPSDLGGERSMLTLREDQRGYIAVTRQVAYVAAFELTQTQGGGAVADPRIDVVQDGVLLAASMGRAQPEGATALQLELTLSELDQPMPERPLELLHGGAPITIQLPTGVSRKLSLQSQLRSDEALVFGAHGVLPARGASTLIAIVQVDWAEPAP